MIVYGSSLSPYVRKVLAFAGEKGIEVESRVMPAGPKPDEFTEASPFGKIPAMRDGDFTLCDSSAIIHYMDALKPEPPLIPTTPRERGQVIWYEEFADTILTAAGAKIFFNRIVAPRFLGRDGDLAAAETAEQEDLPPLFDFLEKNIPESLHLVGDRLTLADLAVASPFANFRHLGLALDSDRHPRLIAFSEVMLERESFRKWTDKETKILRITK
jgi:glutathione S-transferase